jgi:DNA-binding transcriptional ArsR family regulator
MTDDRCDLLCLDLDKAEALRSRALPLETAERAARDAKALGDPTRVMLAAALAATDELCVCDLAWISGRAENLVSHHVRALRTAGLATSRRAGKMVMYSMTTRGRALLEAITTAEAMS